MTPACMSPDELALWQDANGTLTRKATVPCIDCPLSFASEMRDRGCCNGTPKPIGRPRWDVTPERAAQIRDASRRYRARVRRRRSVVAGNRRRRAEIKTVVEAIRLMRAQQRTHEAWL